MTSVRPAAVAGIFYPADPAELRSQIQELLESADAGPVDVLPRMIIVPHAGYIYSGGVAAAAYRLLESARRNCQRAVVVGPSHFVRFPGLATTGASGLATPLGIVRVDEGLTARAEGGSMVAARPGAHQREHSLEVQLPFLQVAVDYFTVVALATGDVAAPAAATVLDDLIEPGVVCVVSSDLSHYLDYAAARDTDAQTADSIEQLRFEAIGPRDACGRTAIQAALLVAASRSWQCRRVALANSGDTAGSPDRVVGYGAFVIGPALD